MGRQTTWPRSRQRGPSRPALAAPAQQLAPRCSSWIRFRRRCRTQSHFQRRPSPRHCSTQVGGSFRASSKQVQQQCTRRFRFLPQTARASDGPHTFVPLFVQATPMLPMLTMLPSRNRATARRMQPMPTPLSCCPSCTTRWLRSSRPLTRSSWGPCCPPTRCKARAGYQGPWQQEGWASATCLGPQPLLRARSQHGAPSRAGGRRRVHAGQHRLQHQHL